MTLKCKIKEISEIESQIDFEKYEPTQESSNEELEDEFQLKEMGTIEQIHSKKPSKKFYDRNSITRKQHKRGKSRVGSRAP